MVFLSVFSCLGPLNRQLGPRHSTEESAYLVLRYITYWYMVRANRTVGRRLFSSDQYRYTSWDRRHWIYQSRLWIYIHLVKIMFITYVSSDLPTWRLPIHTLPHMMNWVPSHDTLSIQFITYTCRLPRLARPTRAPKYATPGILILICNHEFPTPESRQANLRTKHPCMN